MQLFFIMFLFQIHRTDTMFRIVRHESSVSWLIYTLIFTYKTLAKAFDRDLWLDII